MCSLYLTFYWLEPVILSAPEVLDTAVSLEAQNFSASMANRVFGAIEYFNTIV